MEISTLQKMSKAKLLELAAQRNVPLRKALKKQALVDALHGSFVDTPAAAHHGAHAGPFSEPFAKSSAKTSVGTAPGMQQAVEESRFYTGVPEQGASVIPSELPWHYNSDSIVLLVRDPHWAYTYWEVTHGKLEAGMSQLGCGGCGSLTLRVYDVTDTDFNGHNAHGYKDISVFERVGNWYVNTGMPGRSFIIDLGLKAPDGRFVTLARSNAVRTPPDSVSDVLDEEWVLPEQDYRRVFALSGGYSTFGASSAELHAAAAQRLPFGVASPGMGSMALMSPMMRKKERAFWFVLNTELVVYGATEPDATVTVLGERVSLRPDGTFTMRFALPDGTQVIPVSATSADEVETRWITPEVHKDTH
jgi:hypothetical protein